MFLTVSHKVALRMKYNFEIGIFHWHSATYNPSAFSTSGIRCILPYTSLHTHEGKISYSSLLVWVWREQFWKSLIMIWKFFQFFYLYKIYFNGKRARKKNTTPIHLETILKQSICLGRAVNNTIFSPLVSLLAHFSSLPTNLALQNFAQKPNRENQSKLCEHNNCKSYSQWGKRSSSYF